MAFGGSFISGVGRSYKGGGGGVGLPLVFFFFWKLCVVAFVSLLPTLLFVPVRMIKI